MRLATPYSAILSALIFNAIIIPCLIPLAMKGVKYRPMSSGKLLARNMLIYGLGGVITPFVGIKIIDTLIAPMLTAIGMVGFLREGGYVMKESVKSILHSARQTVGVTVILMLVCGLLFPRPA